MICRAVSFEACCQWALLSGQITRLRKTIMVMIKKESKKSTQKAINKHILTDTSKTDIIGTDTDSPYPPPPPPNPSTYHALTNIVTAPMKNGFNSDSKETRFHALERHLSRQKVTAIDCFVWLLFAETRGK